MTSELTPRHLQALGIVATSTSGCNSLDVSNATGFSERNSVELLWSLEGQGLISTGRTMTTCRRVYHSLPTGDLLWNEACQNPQMLNGSKQRRFKDEALTGITTSGKRSKIKNAALPTTAGHSNINPEEKAIRILSTFLELDKFGKENGLTDAQMVAAIRDGEVTKDGIKYAVAYCKCCERMALFHRARTGGHTRTSACVACRKARRK